jgi:hypothetical protein
MGKSSNSSGVASWPSKNSQASKNHAKNAQQNSVPRSTTAKRGNGKSAGRPRGSKNMNRRDHLLKRLNVDVEYLASQPQIAPLMKQCGILPARLIEVLRADENGASQTVVALWDSLTRASQNILGVDALSVAAGLTPRRLWELYSGATMIQSRESLGVLIAESLPTIMKVTIKEAKKVKGYSSREHIFKAARVLPTPKGSVINIGVPQEKALEDGDDDDDAPGGLLESSDDFLMRASRAMSAKALPAPAQPEILEPEEEEDDDE